MVIDEEVNKRGSDLKTQFKDADLLIAYMGQFDCVLWVKIEAIYFEELAKLRALNGDATDYVEKYWLDKWAEELVAFHTHKHLTFGF